MRIVIILLMTVFFNLSKSYGQILTFTEMKSLLTKDISQSEDFLIEKKYKFYNQEKRNGCSSYDFANNQNTYNEKASAFVTIQICTSGKTIYQSISNEKVIPKIKLDAVNQGLKYIKTDNFENKIVHYYKNKSYDLMIMSIKSDEGFTIYEIALEKL